MEVLSGKNYSFGSSLRHDRQPYCLAAVMVLIGQGSLSFARAELAFTFSVMTQCNNTLFVYYYYFSFSKDETYRVLHKTCLQYRVAQLCYCDNAKVLLIVTHLHYHSRHVMTSLQSPFSPWMLESKWASINQQDWDQRLYKWLTDSKAAISNDACAHYDG